MFIHSSQMKAFTSLQFKQFVHPNNQKLCFNRVKSAEERGRWQCQFLVGIEANQEFGVVGRLLGRRGANMKRIAGRMHPICFEPSLLIHH